jgi:hypothetical protein
VSTVGNQNAAFWSRPWIVGAQMAVDVWATVRHHRLQGCDGIPTFAWLDERDHYVMRLVKAQVDRETAKKAGIKRRKSFLEIFTGTAKQFDALAERGRAVVEEITLDSTTDFQGKLTAVHGLYLCVAETIVDFGSPIGMEALLLHRYPRSGPYARPVADTEYRRFRPAELMVFCGHMRGRHVERKIDGMLSTIEREFVTELANRGIERRSCQKTDSKVEKVGQVQEDGK